MCGGKENADRSKEVWPRTERIFCSNFPKLEARQKNIHRSKG
jgi:hypothetical protein